MESEAKERWSKLGRCSTVDLENTGRDHLLRNTGSFWKLGKARNQLPGGTRCLDSRPVCSVLSSWAPEQKNKSVIVASQQRETRVAPEPEGPEKQQREQGVQSRLVVCGVILLLSNNKLRNTLYLERNFGPTEVPADPWKARHIIRCQESNASYAPFEESRIHSRCSRTHHTHG